jgi:hypothetical protein
LQSIIPETFFSNFGNFLADRWLAEHDEDVIQMNEVRCRASGWVQRAAPKVDGMIDEPGHSTGHSVRSL